MGLGYPEAVICEGPSADHYQSRRWAAAQHWLEVFVLGGGGDTWPGHGPGTAKGPDPKRQLRAGPSGCERFRVAQPVWSPTRRAVVLLGYAQS